MTISTLGFRLAKARVLASTSAITLFAGGLPMAPAFAQTAPQSAQDTAQAPAVEEVVVTGTRIVRDGYQAPTPVSVLSADDLNAMADSNVIDSIDRLPQFTGSVTQRTGAVNLSSGAAGVNYVNLRGLGTNRVLVLLDGERIINAGYTSGFTGVDTNTMPQNLISRVDVVTGGASAQYGSDALSGVVNFVLDKEFTGVKGDVQGGVSTYGDDRNYKVSIAAGTPFADGRGHLLLSGEIDYNAGLNGVPRPWDSQGGVVLSNPNRTATNGQPQYIVGQQVGLSDGTPGGLIASGPLKGIYFGPGGTPAQFNYGLVSNNNLMQGGDWQLSRIDQGVDLDPRLERQNAYARASYDFTDNFSVHGELQYGRAHATNTNDVNHEYNDVTILTGNPFIPASIQQQMTALGLTSILLGSTTGDIGRFVADNVRQLRRWVIGGDGKFEALGTEWKWDAYYQASQEGLSPRTRNSVLVSELALAQDAVRNPATGAIVCRSTLTNPTNGCVPFDFFGTGVNSQAAVNYVVGVAHRYDSLRQDVASATLNGEPFSTWAGPVSVATGIEHRLESANSINTPDDQASNFLAGDYKLTVGSYEVTEGFVETVIPLAKGVSWAKELDLSAAIRATSYTTTGYVTTWKVGATWDVIDDVRFRATRSRDIRAPYLGELFAGGVVAGASTFADPFTGIQGENGYTLTAGNASLQPETATTTGLGMVLSPTFFPGFNASVDYYNIYVTNAIAVPNAQQVVNGCFAGITAFCPDIIRTGVVTPGTTYAPITTVITSPENIASQTVRGLDVESSYTLHLADMVSSWEGSLTLRALASFALKIQTVNNSLSSNQVVDGLGVLGGFGISGFSGLTQPRYQYNATIGYSNDMESVTVDVHHIASGVYNNALTSCASGCPNSTNTINNNYIAGSTVVNLALAYRPFHEGSNTNTELYLTINNILNQAPPFIAGGNGSGYYSGPAVRGYDTIGRFFTAGVRFKI